MPTSTIRPRLAPTKILFADHDADTRFAYHSIATADGFAVELARDGHEALALAHVTSPDVVVIDTKLSGLDGRHVIRRLRASPMTSQIPIIVVSAEDGAGLDADLRAAGCNARLLKPCAVDSLLKLATVLAARRRDCFAAAR